MKKQSWLRTASFFFAIILLALSMSPHSFAAGTDKFDLDVVFVIDNSGSMLRSDPSKLALSASNLFIDMCEGSDSRVGYVMYTHEVCAEQPLTDIQTFSQQLKRSIADTAYQSNGDTDTALGLERAYAMLERDALNGKSSRKPMVILLSDGNTDLPKATSRTTAESLSALNVVKSQFASAGVPIYTIGFNYDGKLDVDAMGAIADDTGAILQVARTADKLPSVLRNIYAHLTGSVSINTLIDVTGSPQTINIPIDNESIFKATVTISSQHPIENVFMEDPEGIRYDENGLSSKVSLNKDPNGHYLLFTMHKPVKGNWTLHFTGTKDDVVSIDLLSVYDLTFVMETPVPGINEAEISWHLEDEQGNRINDRDLIDRLTVTLHAQGADDVMTDFPNGQTSHMFTLTPGDYEAYLTMKSDDIDENKKSNTKTFSIQDVPSVKPLELFDLNNNSMLVKLTTIFKTSDVAYLNDLIRYTKENEPLSVQWKNGDWENFVELAYDASNDIDVSALKSGKSETEITVTGSDGSSVVVYLNAEIASGLLILIIAGAVLLLAAGGLVLFLITRKPYLDEPMRDFAILVNNLPDNYEYPPETRMRLEHVKQRRNLKQIIDWNREYRDAYNEAFRDIEWFVAGTVFFAKRKDTLIVTIPVNSRYSVMVDGKKLSKPYIGQFSKNRKLVATLSEDDENTYEIIIGESVDFDDGGDAFNYGASGSSVGAEDDFDLV